MKKILFILVFLAVFAIPVCAEGENGGDDIYLEEYKISGADKLPDILPDSTKSYFEENGIDPSEYTWVNGISGENVFRHIWNFLKDGVKTPLKCGAGILGIILITGVVAAACEGQGAMSAAVYASVLSTAAVLAAPIYASVSASVGAMKACSTFMLSFIPVFAVIVAASGAPVTSASSSGLLLLATQAVSYFSSFVILPLMGGYLALSVSSSVSPLINRSGIAEGIKKIAVWVLSAVSTVFVGILSVQTAVNSAADNLSVKTAKFILGTAVPVAGTALSEAVNTVTASMGLLKSSVGIYGTVAAAAIFLPLIIELLMWRAVLIFTGAVSELMSLPKISSLLKAVDVMISLLVGIMLLTLAVFIISLTVVVTFGKQ